MNLVMIITSIFIFRLKVSRARSLIYSISCQGRLIAQNGFLKVCEAFFVQRRSTESSKVAIYINNKV